MQKGGWHAMLRRLALLALLGVLCACDLAPRDKEAKQPAAPEKAKAAEVLLTPQQADALSAECEKVSRDQFRRAWKDGSETTAEEKMVAEFTHHYNAKLKTCFYLLTVNRTSVKSGQSGAIAGTLNKMLFDVNGGELYGEYLGPATNDPPPATFPKICMVESLYCASGREWDVLVRPYMEN